MLRLSNKNWLWMLPVLVSLFLYIPQSIAGLSIYSDEINFKVFSSLLIGGLAYYFAYLVFPTNAIDRLYIYRPERFFNVLAFGVVVAFCFVSFVACITAETIPLIEALKGASYMDLFHSRNDFLKGRVGADQLVNYAFTIMSQSVMPLAITYAFWARRRWRHLGLIVFGLCLSLTLSKGIFVCALAPLLALFLCRGRWISAALAVFVFVMTVGAMYYLASGKLGDGVDRIPTEISGQTGMPSDVPDQYSLFSEKTQANLIINRIVWIPYVTFVDWFRYQETVLEGNYIYGQSIRPLAMLMGQDRVFIESEVATFQWGGPSGATSNALYIADAWLNWGAFGVFIYSVIFAITIKIIASSGYLPLTCAAVVPVWTACFSALPPVYLSAGLGLLLFLAIILRKGPDRSP